MTPSDLIQRACEADLVQDHRTALVFYSVGVRTMLATAKCTSDAAERSRLREEADGYFNRAIALKQELQKMQNMQSSTVDRYCTEMQNSSDGDVSTDDMSNGGGEQDGQPTDSRACNETNDMSPRAREVWGHESISKLASSSHGLAPGVLPMPSTPPPDTCPEPQQAQSATHTCPDLSNLQAVDSDDEEDEISSCDPVDSSVDDSLDSPVLLEHQLVALTQLCDGFRNQEENCFFGRLGQASLSRALSWNGGTVASAWAYVQEWQREAMLTGAQDDIPNGKLSTCNDSPHDVCSLRRCAPPASAAPQMKLSSGNVTQGKRCPRCLRLKNSGSACTCCQTLDRSPRVGKPSPRRLVKNRTKPTGPWVAGAPKRPNKSGKNGRNRGKITSTANNSSNKSSSSSTYVTVTPRKNAPTRSVSASLTQACVPATDTVHACATQPLSGRFLSALSSGYTGLSSGQSATCSSRKGRPKIRRTVSTRDTPRVRDSPRTRAAKNGSVTKPLSRSEARAASSTSGYLDRVTLQTAPCFDALVSLGPRLDLAKLLTSR
eukprot:SAG31_NODE_234_length_19701_cov_16.835068_3_plen_547_part_00